MAVPLKLTVDSFEAQLQTIYLAPFLLVKTLLPVLIASRHQQLARPCSYYECIKRCCFRHRTESTKTLPPEPSIGHWRYVGVVSSLRKIYLGRR